jgi:hypothetical protein
MKASKPEAGDPSANMYKSNAADSKRFPLSSLATGTGM